LGVAILSVTTAQRLRLVLALGTVNLLLVTVVLGFELTGALPSDQAPALATASSPIAEIILPGPTKRPVAGRPGQTTTPTSNPGSTGTVSPTGSPEISLSESASPEPTPSPSPSLPAVPVVAVVGSETATPGDTQEPGTGAEPPLSLSKGNLGAAIGQLNGKKDFGDLKDAQGLKDCLDAHELPSSGDPIGVSPVTLDGKPGIAAMLGAGTQPGHYRIVVVEPTCTAEEPGEVLANAEVP